MKLIILSIGIAIGIVIGFILSTIFITASNADDLEEAYNYGLQVGQRISKTNNENIKNK